MRRHRDEGRKKSNEDKEDARGSDDKAAHEATMATNLKQQAMAAALVAGATTEEVIAT